jgi:hypothetical protein
LKLKLHEKLLALKRADAEKKTLLKQLNDAENDKENAKGDIEIKKNLGTRALSVWNVFLMMDGIFLP